MLHQFNMPNKFWVEAILTSCYLQNRCAHIVFKNKVWTGYKPSLNHIKMFGCDSYVHVPSKLRKSLDSKTKVCKLLGYSKNVKVYKLYDTQSNKVIVRKDVMFNGFQTNFKSQHKTSRSRLSYNLQWRIKSSTLQCKPPFHYHLFQPQILPHH
jgi:hypothetical protein